MKQATREAYGKALAELGKENENIVVLDADLSKSTKTADFAAVCPERFFNAGIAEQNMTGVAAGLATCGKIPFISSFAVFAAGRNFEQIRNSIAYPKLNVKIAATHAGITVGEDGGSHQAIEDISLMRTLPNMTVVVPCDGVETAAAVKAVKERTEVAMGNLCFTYRSGILFVTLPSGRKLSYIKPRMTQNRFGRESLSYEGVGESKKWMRIETYGPKLVENIVQATARDLLALAMLRLRNKGFEIVMHIHDEAVLEVPEGVSSVEEICQIMSEQPDWAAGLPLRADGYECAFYKKD